MRCDEVRTRLEEGEAAASEPLGGHLRQCADCRAWLEDWQWLRQGFQALAVEPVPEPQLGFRARLMRRLTEPANSPRERFDFFERAGRRVVWATLVLTLALLLGMALPSTGPMRGPDATEFLFAQPTLVSAQSDMVVGVDAADVTTAAPTGRSQ